MLNSTGKVPCCIDGNVWIISINLHPKGSCCICHHASDSTKTDDTKLFAHDLTACKLFLLFLSKLINIFLVFFSLYPLNTSHNVTGSKKHTGKNQLLYTICIGSRSIKYNDAFLCTLFHRNVIDSSSGTCDHSNTLRQLHVMHLGTSYKNCLAVIQSICFFIIIIKNVQAFLGDRIQAMILKHQAFSSSNFFMNATSASTPAFGIAL